MRQLEIAENARTHQLRRNYEHLLEGDFSIKWRDMSLFNLNIAVRKYPAMEIVLEKHFKQPTTENQINVITGVGSYTVTINAGAGNALGFITIKPPPQSNSSEYIYFKNMLYYS